MKKLLTLLMAFAMTLSLVACGGGPDKQPAIDAVNKASDAFNEVANKMNENIDLYPQDLISDLNEMVYVLNEQVDLLSSDTDLTQEELDAIVEAATLIETWATETSPLLDDVVSTQPVNDAYTAAANAYNEVAIYMNENLESFTEEDIAAVTEVGELLMECEATLKDVTFTDSQSLDDLIQSLKDIENWALEVKTALGI